MGKLKEALDRHQPAFPVHTRLDDEEYTSVGLSRRDYFAAAALTGYLAHYGEPRKTSMDGPSEEEQRRVASLKMYRWADAMLAAGKVGS